MYSGFILKTLTHEFRMKNFHSLGERIGYNYNFKIIGLANMVRVLIILLAIIKV